MRRGSTRPAWGLATASAGDWASATAWGGEPREGGDVAQNGPTNASPERPVDPDVPGPTAQAAGVEMVAPASCEVGAHCVVSVRVACPADAQCELDTPGRLAAFEVLQVREPGVVAAAGRAREWHLTLVAFDPGSHDLPPLSVRVVNTADGATRVAATPPARIEVRLAAGEEAAPLRPDAPPMDPGPDWRMVAAWIVGGLVVLAVLALAWRWWRARTGRPAPLAPEVTAARAIAAIRAIAQTPAGGPDEVLVRYRELSHALRGYLGLPLEVPATALTSTELVRAIDGVRRRAAAGHARDRHERTRALLVEVDEVKFGGARPDEPTRAGHCRRAIDLIEELERTRPDGGKAGRGVA